MREAKHFQRDGRGVFKCAVCDRNTRITHQDRDSPLCYECYECAGYENAVQDGGDLARQQEHVSGYVAHIEKKGGNMVKFYKQFSVLFPNGPVKTQKPAKVKKTKSQRVRLTTSQVALLVGMICVRKDLTKGEREIADLIQSAKSIRVRI